MKNNKKVLITCTEEKHSLTFNAFLRFIHSFCFHMQTPGTFDQCGALGSWIIITSASNQSRCENHDDGVTSRKTVTAADLFARVSASEMTNVRQIPPVLILLPVAILKHVVTRRFWLANRDNEGRSCSSYSVTTTSNTQATHRALQKPVSWKMYKTEQQSDGRRLFVMCSSNMAM